MIQFKQVSKFYNGTIALDNVNLKIDQKEFVSIVGRSGAGKTTLFRLLIAEEKPTSGKVIFEGRDIHQIRLNQVPLLRRRIALIFQDFQLLPKKTVFENVAFALEVAGRSDKEIAEFVPQILNLVGIEDKASNFPAQLSGGEKQRVAIARALIQRPNVILADEPTGNLDPITSQEIIKLLFRINELGTTIILATHNRDVVNKISRRVVTMDQGKIIRDEDKGRYNIS